MSDDTPTVLYITGMMRCGSTVIGNILDELDDVTHIGERYFLVKNALLRDGTNTLCGCGEDLLECPVWSKVLAELGGPDRAEARLLWDAQQRDLRVRHSVPRLLGRSARGGERSIDDVADAAVATYRAVASVRRAGVVVDSSKVPAEAAVLARRGDIDLRVLHVVRDPRATVASYREPKEYLEQLSTPRALAYWAGFNAASDALRPILGPDRYRRVRYEDFARAPRSTMAGIAEFAGCSPDAVRAAFTSEDTIELRGNHTVTGNPDRLRTGQVRISDGERWRTSLPTTARLGVALGALPQLLAYGYRG